jgi:hypothetical protein
MRSLAAAAPVSGTVDQCNNTGSVGGDTITCAFTVTNDFAYNAATPDQPTGLATVVATINCTGSAICPTGSTTTSTSPVVVISQCNTAGLGGASTVTCTVTVTNNLSGYPIGAAIDSTVMQCQSPGGVNTLTCVATPAGNSRSGTAGPGGQRVTQCNGSGGAGGTMTCTVTAPPSQSTGLPTTINQCDGSGTTGASTVTCTATITNNFTGSIAGEEGPGDTGGGPTDTGGGPTDTGGGPTDTGGGPTDTGGGPTDTSTGTGPVGSGTPGASTTPTGASTPTAITPNTPNTRAPLETFISPRNASAVLGETVVHVTPNTESNETTTHVSRAPTTTRVSVPLTRQALPFTGLDVRILALAGILMLLLGAAMRRARRNKTPAAITGLDPLARR